MIDYWFIMNPIRGSQYLEFFFLWNLLLFFFFYIFVGGGAYSNYSFSKSFIRSYSFSNLSFFIFIIFFLTSYYFGFYTYLISGCYINFSLLSSIFIKFSCLTYYFTRYPLFSYSPNSTNSRYLLYSLIFISGYYLI